MYTHIFYKRNLKYLINICFLKTDLFPSIHVVMIAVDCILRQVVTSSIFEPMADL